MYGDNGKPLYDILFCGDRRSWSPTSQLKWQPKYSSTLINSKKFNLQGGRQQMFQILSSVFPRILPQRGNDAGGLVDKQELYVMSRSANEKYAYNSRFYGIYFIVFDTVRIRDGYIK